jgi:hypothetical protein
MSRYRQWDPITFCTSLICAQSTLSLQHCRSTTLLSSNDTLDCTFTSQRRPSPLMCPPSTFWISPAVRPTLETSSWYYPLGMSAERKNTKLKGIVFPKASIVHSGCCLPTPRSFWGSTECMKHDMEIERMFWNIMTVRFISCFLEVPANSHELMIIFEKSKSRLRDIWYSASTVGTR